MTASRTIVLASLASPVPQAVHAGSTGAVSMTRPDGQKRDRKQETSVLMTGS